MKTLVIVSVLLHIVWSMPSIQTKNEWQLWTAKYEKIYASEQEEQLHFKIWNNNYRFVNEHNANPERSFDVELNHLADQKLQRSHLDMNALMSEHNRGANFEQGDLTFVPDSWDWRLKGAIGPVRSQGAMGEAQSIVAAECVESYYEINQGRLVDVSVMQVHDCCVKSSFLSKNIFQCIHNIGGLCSSGDYPTSVGSCKNNTCSAVAQINGGMSVPSGDETALKAAVYKMPVFAAIDAGLASFQLYRGGIYSDPKCRSSNIDHVIQIVGYGSMNGDDYWICKNSWGTGWGENGYIKIARNKNNMCGIATAAIFPV